MCSTPTVTCSPPSFAIPARQAPTPLNPMREIPVGTHIRVTGICMLTDANPFNGEVPFNILMRTVDDIVVVARPPWLNVRHLILIVGLLLLVVFAVGIRSWAIERRVRQENRGPGISGAAAQTHP